MKSIVRLLLPNLLLALPLWLAVEVAAEDWPQWRGAERANRSSETGLFEKWGADGPPLAWVAEGTGKGYASVSVMGDRVYTTGNVTDGQAVIAVDANRGEIVWSQTVTDEVPKHGYDGSRTTPTIDGGKLYVVSSDGKIVCLSATDGQEIWSRDFQDWQGKMMSGWGYSESPLVDGDLVICTPGGPEGIVVALNKNTGKDVWAAVLEGKQVNEGGDLKSGAGYASPIISNGGGVKQYVQLVGRGLIGVRATDGEVLWRYDRVGNRTANIPTAIIDGDYVFTSTGYNTGSALLKLRGNDDGGVDVKEVYWLESGDLQNKHGGMTLVDGHIYCGHGNGNGLPICVEMATGDVSWGPERAKGKGETSLIYADGHVIFRRENGLVILAQANPEKFEVVQSFMPVFQQGKSWAHPAIANGKLYLREQNKLMCYQLK